MEVSVVRQRVRELIDRSKRPPEERRAARRAQMDAATREYELFLERTAVPLFKQIANVLRAEKYQFEVFTPGGSVRLMAERGNDNYIEILLDTNGQAPKLVGRASRSRGGNVTQTELVLNATSDISALTEDDLLAFVLSELEAFVDR
ncbi:MAG TPA: hypothetical protein VLV86_02075 [Vicinamibacterales bacterium]|nr:hypothetical protein [Vicinamibacterales bacterium]